ncbi:hypothetical protein C4J81_12830 [Deltaproteobacteria bacterium Smac51]|nr:hypothetical protein C4J81_12830 [Deltaproteobacteria bacterium Smac51]
MILTAGREEENPRPIEVKPEEDLPFLNVGRAEGDEVHVSGALIGDPRRLESSLELFWYFPDEETAEAARPVDPSETTVTVTMLPRRKAEPGWRWRYRLESSRPYLETRFFEGGFLPPFNPADVHIYIDHLINYNYDGYVLSRLDYNYRPPAYTEAAWRIPIIEGEGYLED